MFRLVFCIICIVIVLGLALYAAYCGIEGQPICAPYDIEMVEFTTDNPEYGMLVIPAGAEFRVLDSDEHWTHVKYKEYEGYVLNLNMP